MKSIRILFADNDPNSLGSYAEVLRRKGYTLLCAGSHEEARNLLSNGYFHIAILDLRLRDDRDNSDISGLQLARESDPTLAKILLTTFPSFETARDALVPGPTGARAVISYISKHEPLSLLFETVEHAIKSLNLRDEQFIEWNAVDRISLIQRLSPETIEQRFMDYRVAEIEDVIAQLFPAATKVSLERILWEYPQRSAILARAVFTSGSKSSLIVLGAREIVGAEAETFHALGLNNSWLGVPSLERKSAKAHFAANLFIFNSLDLQHSRGFGEIFRHASEKMFLSAAQKLSEGILPVWHRQAVVCDKQPINSAYAGRLQCEVHPHLFTDAINQLNDDIAGLGIGFKVKDNLLHAWVKGHEHVFPEPGQLLCNMSLTKPIPLYPLPGVLDGQNILVDDEGHIGLTNFAEAGGGPLLAPCLELEAAIRFDCSESVDFTRLYEIEVLLAQHSFSRLPISDFEPEERKMLHAVVQVRRYAEVLLNGELWDWHVGLLFEIASRIAAFRGKAQDSLRYAHKAHLIMAAGVIAQAMTKQKPPSPAIDRERGLVLDMEKQSVLIEGSRVRLPRQSFRLLKCLYDNGNVCGVELLITRGLGESRYDPSDRSQSQRLATAIRRLRKRIERKPEEPEFLLTETGGYRLYRDSLQHR